MRQFHGSADLTADHQRLTELGANLFDGLDQVQVTVDSADGLVTVVAGARGEVLELDLDPRIYHTQDAGALARKITDTIRVAREEAMRESERFLTTLIGESGDDVRPLLQPALDALDPDDGRR